MSSPILHWHLRTQMLRKGFRSIVSLHRALKERGILISRVQLARVVNELPVRLNTHLLLSLCTVLDCAPGQLLSLEPIEVAEIRRRRRNKQKAALTITDIKQLVGPSFKLRRTILSDNDG
jgi:DNA-binding Xre family transcriptional regulator